MATEGWRLSPLTYMPHEGSFYPIWLLRAFTARLHSGSKVFDPYAQPTGACGWFCSWEWPEEELLKSPLAVSSHGPPDSGDEVRRQRRKVKPLSEFEVQA